MKEYFKLLNWLEIDTIWLSYFTQGKGLHKSVYLSDIFPLVFLARIDS